MLKYYYWYWLFRKSISIEPKLLRPTGPVKAHG